MPGVFPLLLIAFIVVPIVELAVIIQVGGYIGVWETIGLLILDSVVGAVLVKREGRRAWDAFRRALAETRWPGDEVTQGALVLFGGALLLTPGFVTDLVGLFAVIPPTRALASRVLRRAVTPGPVREVFRLREDRARHRGRQRGSAGSRAGQPGGGEVLDVEVVRTERDEPRGGADAGGPGARGALGEGGSGSRDDRGGGDRGRDGRTGDGSAAGPAPDGPPPDGPGPDDGSS